MTCACPLGSAPIVRGEGPIPCRIAVIGEAPGYLEAKHGRPFIGPSGQFLDELLALAGFRRGEVYVTNVVACRPPNNRTPAPNEIVACRARLEGELAAVNPEIIIALGKTAVDVVAPNTKLGAYHGLAKRSGGKIVVIMYHPAAALHKPALRAAILQDWQRLPDRLALMAQVNEELAYRRGDSVVLKGNLTVAVDTEFDGKTMLLASAASEPGHAISCKQLKRGRHSGLVVMHNAKFDIKVLPEFADARLADTMIAAYLVGEQQLGLKPLALKRLGIEMDNLGAILSATQELMMGEYLHNVASMRDVLPKPMQKSLDVVLESEDKAKALSHRHALRGYIGQPPEPTLTDALRLLPDRFHNYAAADADMTWRLWPGLLDEMKGMGVDKLFWDVEMPLVPVLAHMEQTGLAIDREKAASLNGEFTEKAAQIKQELYQTTGLENPDSRDQVARVLYDVLGLPVLAKTDTGKPSTERWVMESLAENEPIVGQILQYRRYVKLTSTYLEPWLLTSGRIHPDFNQVRQRSDEDAWGATATGRLSSSGPNFQNVPVRTPEGRAVRSCIVAEPGNLLLAIDDRQIELMLMAIDAEDADMLHTFSDPNGDIHAETARMLFDVDDPTYDQRFVGKQVNFMWGYGIRYKQFVRSLLVQSIHATEDQAKGWLATFEAKRPKLKARWGEVAEEAQKRGYAETFWGRRRYLPELVVASTEYEWYEAAKQAYSHRIQGTAADISKLVAVRLHGLLKQQALSPGLICLIHDERLVELPKAILTPEWISGIIKELLAAVAGLIPHAELLGMSAKMGKDWGNMKEVA